MRDSRSCAGASRTGADFPTVGARGHGPVSVLPRAVRTDLDAVTFTPLGGSAPMTWAQSLDANYTDGILVMHRGRVVYERYFGR